MKIGLIGLGIMGLPMGRNLLKAGYDLTVYDRRTAPMEALAQSGARTAPEVRALAEATDVLLTMLPNSPDVRAVVLGEGGALEAMRPGSVLVDMSSINPMVSVEIAAALRERGVEMLDTPVSGGEPKAVDGTLAFMVGGKQAVFDRLESLLLSMGASAVRCGEVGAGNVAKLCNQIIVAVNIAAVSEALMLGQLAGVEPTVVFRAIRGGLAGSAVMDAKAPMMLEHNFKPGFTIDLHTKDLDNVLDTAKALDAPAMLTGQVVEMMKVLRREGHGACDHSALVTFYERLAGETLRDE